MHVSVIYKSQEGLKKYQEKEKETKNAKILNVDIGLTGDKPQPQ